jgi:hypothetical protein
MACTECRNRANGGLDASAERAIRVSLMFRATVSDEQVFLEMVHANTLVNEGPF